jgi:hypothetical protein
VLVAMVGDSVYGAEVAYTLCALLTLRFRPALEGKPDALLTLADAEHTAGRREWSAHARDALRDVLAAEVDAILDEWRFAASEGDGPAPAIATDAAERVAAATERLVRWWDGAGSVED